MIRLRIELLVDFEWNYVTLCIFINFEQNWESVRGESYWPNRALLFYFIYVKRVLDANCLYKKFKTGRLLAVTFGLLDFVYLFSILGTRNYEMVFSAATCVCIVHGSSFKHNIHAILTRTRNIKITILFNSGHPMAIPARSFDNCFVWPHNNFYIWC